VGPDALLIIIKVLTIFLALGVLTVVLLAVLDATAEMVRLRLQTRRELRLRFGKRIRSRPHLEEDTQELTLDDTQELTPVQRPRRRLQ
jgi:hypothetical protein